MAGLLVGLAVISQMSEVLGSGVALNVRAIKLLVVQELGTLFTALIVLAPARRLLDGSGAGDGCGPEGPGAERAGKGADRRFVPSANPHRRT
jgi:hypothetical protein